MKNFTDIGILPSFTEKLAERGISSPTDIQQKVIPLLLEKKNLIFRSATGTGKTFAYLLPILQNLLYPDHNSLSLVSSSFPSLVICAPTLELCSQIINEINFLIGENGKSALLAGSVNVTRQIETLKKNKPIAVAGNPGRLLLLAEMGKLKFGGLSYFVLDEFDRMTASDSREETSALIRLITEKTGNRPICTAACSATVSSETGKYLNSLLNEAAFIETDKHEVLCEKIEHWAIFCENRRKNQTLFSFLEAVRPKKVLVFTSRTWDAGKIVNFLQNRKVAAVGLYSGMDKKDRKTAIDSFRAGKTSVMISSDLSARGLDIDGISHVIALDVSENKDVYIHRAGRTGRAGKKGIMVCIGDEIEMRRLATLEKKLGIKVHPKELYAGKLFNPTPV